MSSINASSNNLTALLSDELYQESYSASIAVLKNVVPFFADSEGAAAKLSKSVKAVPMLIAEGFHEGAPPIRRSNALSEAALCCREAVVMLSYCRDLHGRFINGALCADLIETYRSVGDRLCIKATEVDSKGEEPK